MKLGKLKRLMNFEGPFSEFYHLIQKWGELSDEAAERCGKPYVYTPAKVSPVNEPLIRRKKSCYKKIVIPKNEKDDPFAAHFASHDIFAYSKLMKLSNFSGDVTEFHKNVVLEWATYKDRSAALQGKPYVIIPASESPVGEPLLRKIDSRRVDVYSSSGTSYYATTSDHSSERSKLDLRGIDGDSTGGSFHSATAGERSAEQRIEKECAGSTFGAKAPTLVQVKGYQDRHHKFQISHSESTYSDIDMSLREYFCCDPMQMLLDSNKETDYALIGESIFKENPSIDAGLLGSLETSKVTATKGAALDRYAYCGVKDPFCMLAIGVQGTGKSHTMNVMLENCLLQCLHPQQLPLVRLQQEMCGLVLHYDRCESNVCEAIGLKDLNRRIGNGTSAAGPQVKRIVVLVSPTFFKQRQRFYADSACEVHPLLFKWSELSALELKKLMALSSNDSQLYVSVMLDLLRGYQRREEVPNFEDFKRQMESCCSNQSQLSPLRQRLQILESIIFESALNEPLRDGYRSLEELMIGGTLIIADLTDPLLSVVEARSIFQVLLGKFRAHLLDCGKVVAFDEAHKYLSNDADELAQSIVEMVRLMRHEGIRIMVSTQSPLTIPSELLELVSFTVLHSFQSRDWFEYLSSKIPVPKDSFERIRRLATGHALLVSARAKYGKGEGTIADCMQIKIRPRITMDYGASRSNVAVSNRNATPNATSSIGAYGSPAVGPMSADSVESTAAKTCSTDAAVIRRETAADGTSDVSEVQPNPAPKDGAVAANDASVAVTDGKVEEGNVLQKGFLSMIGKIRF